MGLARVQADCPLEVNGRVGCIASHALATREPHSYRMFVQELRTAALIVAVVR